MPTEEIAAPVTTPTTETQTPPVQIQEQAKPTLPTLEEIAAQLTAAQGKSDPASVQPVNSEKPVETSEVVPLQPEVKPTETKTNPLESSRFAALSRRAQEIRAQEQAFKNRQAEFEQRHKDFEARETALKTARTPLELLKARGFTYNDATMEAVGAFKPKEIDPVDSKLETVLTPLQAQIKSLSDQLEESNKFRKQYEADKMAAVNHQVMRDYQQVAEEGGYEFTLAFGQEGLNLAKEISLTNHRKNGRLLTYKESLDIVEKHYEKLAKNLLGVKKLQAVTSSTNPNPTPTTSKPSTNPAQAKPQPTATKPNTLTQAHSQATNAKPDIDKMSDKEALDWLAKNVLQYRKD